MRPPRTQIGLAIVGCGTIGRIRAELAMDLSAKRGTEIKLPLDLDEL